MKYATVASSLSRYYSIYLLTLFSRSPYHIATHIVASKSPRSPLFSQSILSVPPLLQYQNGNDGQAIYMEMVYRCTKTLCSGNVDIPSVNL